MKARKRQILKLSFMIFLTFVFFLTEIIFGHVTGSLALIGDSYHMISDVLSLVIGISCLVISTRSSKQNTYGWVRAEVLGALFNSIFLLSLSFTIFIEALERLIHPHHIHEVNILLIVGGVGLAVNVLGLLVFCNETHGHGHSHGSSEEHAHGPSTDYFLARKSFNGDVSPLPSLEVPMDQLADNDQSEDIEIVNGEFENVVAEALKSEVKLDARLELGDDQPDGLLPTQGRILTATLLSPEEKGRKKHSHHVGQMNIRGVFLHIMGDALGSVVVIISALVVKYCEGEWTTRVDPILSLIMVLIIVCVTLPLLKQTSLILLQHAPSHIQLSSLSNRLCSEITSLLDIHDFHVWQLVGSRNVASMHVKCLNSDVYESAASKIRRILHAEGIHSTTIQPEFTKDQEKVLPNICSMECNLDKSCIGGTCCGVKKKK